MLYRITHKMTKNAGGHIVDTLVIADTPDEADSRARRRRYDYPLDPGYVYQTDPFGDEKEAGVITAYRYACDDCGRVVVPQALTQETYTSGSGETEVHNRCHACQDKRDRWAPWDANTAQAEYRRNE